MTNWPPLHATVSELEAFSRCPMEYFLKYDRELPAQQLTATPLTEIPGNRLGDIVHAVIRNCLEQPGTSVAELVDRYATAKEIPHALIPLYEIETLCDRALEFHRHRAWLEWCTEVPFALSLGATIVHGTIDFLGRDATGWHIVDYKTDHLAAKKDMTERAKSYRLQMQTYAAAASRAGTTPLMDTSLLFLRVNDLVTEKITETTADVALQTIEKIVCRISERDYSIAGTPPCRQCPYHHNQMCWEDRHQKTQPA